MNAFADTAGRLSRLQLADLGTQLTLAAATLAVLAATGAAVAIRPALTAVVPIAFVWAIILANWRVGVVALVIFLPFAGIPVFAIDQRWGPVLKDVLLVLPLYLSFLIDVLTSGRRLLPERDVLVPILGAFAGVAIAYMALSPSLLIGAIGLKVWIFYFPLYVIGYHYVRGLSDVVRVLRLTALLALIPAAIAFAEVLYFRGTNGFGPLMKLYGPATSKIVQEVGYAGFGGPFPRIPATFTSAASYYNFGIVAFAAAIGYWRYRRSSLTGLLAIVLGLATIASGIRRSYLMVPLLAFVAAFLMRGGHSAKNRTAFAVVAAVGALLFFNVNVGGLLPHLAEGTHGAVSSTAQQLTPALSHGAIGHGTGSDTNAANRYGGGTVAAWREAWYTKALVEFGILGLVVAVGLILTVLLQAGRNVRLLYGVGREVAAPLAAVLVVTAVTLAKAAELDWDPMNAYFWLFAGLLGGLAATKAHTQVEAS